VAGAVTPRPDRSQNLSRLRLASFTMAAVLASACGSVLADNGPAPPAVSSSPAPKSAAASPRAARRATTPLDLSAPPVGHVLTPQQVQALVAEREDDASPPEDVTVQSEHFADPVPPGAFRALPWALLHPLEAWRIFTPITD
jgi:hypothetical protein